MKTIKLVALLILTMTATGVMAQDTHSGEKYGRTLNLGIGVGYYGYVGRSMPVLHLNYEFDVVRNLTLAPFVSFYTYTKGYYWGDNDNNHPYKDYYYREVVIPVGIKSTYYFDDLLRAGDKWDFYVGGSLGYAITVATWDNDYYGDRDIYRRANPLYADLHIGAELHVSERFGIFLDLSSGVSTFGFAFH